MRWRSRRTRGRDVIREKNHGAGEEGERREQEAEKGKRRGEREKRRGLEREKHQGREVNFAWMKINCCCCWLRRSGIRHTWSRVFVSGKLAITSTTVDVLRIYYGEQPSIIPGLTTSIRDMEYWYRVYTEHLPIHLFYSLTIGILPIGLGFHFHGEMELDKRMRACKYIVTPKYGWLYQIQQYQPCKY